MQPVNKSYCFNLQITEDNKISISNDVENLFKTSNKLKIISVLGPSRHGKSLLLDYLSVKDLGKLTVSKTFSKKDINRVPFKVEPNDVPITINFHCYRISLQEFLEIHFSKSEMNTTPKTNFDLFFIDTEGFNTEDKKSDVLLLGLFSVIGISSIIIDVGKDHFNDTSRLKRIKEHLMLSTMLNELKDSIENFSDEPDYIGVYHGTSIPEFEDDDVTESENIENHLPEIDKIFQEEDRKKETALNTWLSKGMVLSSNKKINIVSMPNIDTDTFPIFKQILKNLANKILSKGKIYQGEERLNKFKLLSEGIVKRYKEAFLTGSLDKLYKEFINSKLEDFKEEFINEANKQLIEKVSNLTNIKENEIEKTINDLKNNFNSYINEKFTEVIQEKFKFIKSEEVNDEDKSFIEEFKPKIEIMRNDIFNTVASKVRKYVILQSLNSIEKHIKKLYDLNPTINLDEIEPGQILLFDLSGNKLKLKIINKWFEIDNKKYYYVFPEKLKIIKNVLFTEDFFIFGIHTLNEKQEFPCEDISCNFYFDPNTLTLTPKPLSSTLFNSQRKIGYFTQVKSFYKENIELLSETNLTFKNFSTEKGSEKIINNLGKKKEAKIDVEKNSEELILNAINLEFDNESEGDSN